MTTTLVGGVSQLYQGDLDLGRHAVARLSAEHTGNDVVFEDLHYGAVAVAQRLEEVSPHTLVLVGALARGREPGEVERRLVDRDPPDTATAQGAVADAVTGYVTVGLVTDVARGLGVLPPHTVTIEVEPTPVDGPCEHLSPAGQAGLDRACALVRTEIRRAPLFELADRVRSRLAEEPPTPTAAVVALGALLKALEVLDSEGRWGSTFRHRDHVRAAITQGQAPEDLTNLDWALWWALLEELDRLGAVEAVEDLY